jgi:hypothetical protein
VPVIAITRRASRGLLRFQQKIGAARWPQAIVRHPCEIKLNDKKNGKHLVVIKKSSTFAIAFEKGTSS